MTNRIDDFQPPGSIRGNYSRLLPQFKEAVDFYLTLEKVKNYEPSTRYRCCSAACSFLHYVQSNRILSFENVQESDVVKFLSRDGKGTYEVSTRYRITEFLEDISIRYPACIAIKNWFPYVRVTRKNIQYLADTEARAIKSACLSDNNGLSCRARAIGLILLFTGLRGCDIADIKLKDINWDKSELHIIQDKTGVPLSLPMITIVGNSIFDYITKERSGNSEYLFITDEGRQFTHGQISYQVTLILKAAGIRQNPGDRKGTHIFRHHMAVSLLDNDVPAPVISAALGHTDPASLETYLSADIKHLRDCALSIEQFPVDWEVFSGE